MSFVTADCAWVTAISEGDRSQADSQSEYHLFCTGMTPKPELCGLFSEPVLSALYGLWTDQGLSGFAATDLPINQALLSRMPIAQLLNQ